MSELAQLYELTKQFEQAEKDGQPVIELAQRIAELRQQIAAQKAAPPQLPHAQSHPNEWAILQKPPVRREPDGDILWA